MRAMMEFDRSVEQILGIGALVLLGVGCLVVLWPFLSALLWAPHGQRIAGSNDCWVAEGHSLPY